MLRYKLWVAMETIHFHIAQIVYFWRHIFETFEDQGMTYDEAVTKLSAYFEPKKNISYERHCHKSGSIPCI